MQESNQDITKVVSLKVRYQRVTKWTHSNFKTSMVSVGIPIFIINMVFIITVDSRYLNISYLDPITYVELISKSRLFSLCIYCISASRMSNYFYVDTSAISSIIFSP